MGLFYITLFLPVFAIAWMVILAERGWTCTTIPIIRQNARPMRHAPRSVHDGER